MVHFGLSFHNCHKISHSHLDRQWQTIGCPSQANKGIFETIKKGGLGAPDEFSNLKNAQDLDQQKIHDTVFKIIGQKT